MADLIDDIKLLFADSTTFRTWTGAADQAAALTFIDDVAGDEGSARPRVLIGDFEEDYTEQQYGFSVFSPAGSVTVLVYDEVGTGNIENDGTVTVANKQAILEAFRTNVRNLIRDVKTLGRSAGYVLVRDFVTVARVTLVGRVQRKKRQAKGVAVDVELELSLTFGLDAAAADISGT